jgi:hypothetical protein
MTKFLKKSVYYLMTIPYFLLWVIYFIFTLEARDRYIMGTSKGYHCYSQNDASRFIYGSVTEYHFDPNTKPYREYLTWKEFWSARGYGRKDQ